MVGEVKVARLTTSKMLQKIDSADFCLGTIISPAVRDIFLANECCTCIVGTTLLGVPLANLMTLKIPFLQNSVLDRK